LAKNAVLLELIAVMVIAQFVFWFVPEFKFAYTLLPFLYIVVERRLRHRSWQELGFKRRGLRSDLKANWHLFVLVAVVIQLVVVLGSRLWYPELYMRFWSRVELLAESYGRFASMFMFVPLMTLSIFLEELVFRGFAQERLGWFVNRYSAIIIASVVFTLSHFATGRLDTVITDMLLVFLDSSLYGLIYARTRNLLLAWGAHLIADYVDLILMFLL